MPATRIEPLIDSEWLENELSSTDLRILDCTVTLGPDGAVSGRANWEAGHIPRSQFADLINDLSDPNNKRYSFPFPPAEQFAAVMSRLGVGDGTRVVLYDAGPNMWAARLWWMLRAYGFDDAGVLEGGFKRWTREQRPVTTEVTTYPPGSFVARPRPELIATKDEVLESISNGSRCIVNALSADAHSGKTPPRHGRPGHITSSVNVPVSGAGSIVDPENLTYLPLDQIRAQFEAAGALDKERVITYCGGGIAASSAAFALHLIGVDNVAVYDGSLSEWAVDPSLPMETI
ncbi:MAG TPA: sulfurtransferase [Nitrolancea sp.]|jgi:thiosulfate/3-mercaptopyruvate sulfurtransferase|nr:sulfurtransferase [Nitrolancea sp.]